MSRLFRAKRHFLLYKWLVLPLVLALLFMAAAIYYYPRFPGPNTHATQVIIPKGQSTYGTIVQLHKQTLIRSPEAFKLYYKLRYEGEPFVAGEYIVPSRATPNQIIQLFLSGDVVERRVTVLEGQTVHQVLEQLAEVEGLEGPIIGPFKEGTFFPDTYYYHYGDSAMEFIYRMQNRMKRKARIIWRKYEENGPGHLDTIGELLTLASLIEKETYQDAERPLVASVFYNRLKKGMRLQTDPTVIYAASDGKGYLGRRILKSELRADHPYNTYRNYGLPPGPIANPGLDSLEAAAFPAISGYYFFVANGKGGHWFAKTYAEHKKNVKKYRELISRN